MFGLAFLGSLARIRSRLGVVGGPVGLLAPGDLVERRAGEVDAAVVEQAGEVAVEEGQQERGDVVAVAVGVGQEDDLAVAEPGRVVLVVHPAAQGADDVGQLLVVEHLGLAGLLGVEDLALRAAGSPGCRGRGPAWPSRRRESPSTMNSSDSSGLVLSQSWSLPGRLSRLLIAVLRRTWQAAARLASRALAAWITRCGDRVADALVLEQEVFEPGPDHRLDQRPDLGVVQPPLGLPLELRLVDADREDGRQPLADVLALDLDPLLDEVVVLHEPQDGRAGRPRASPARGCRRRGSGSC